MPGGLFRPTLQSEKKIFGGQKKRVIPYFQAPKIESYEQPLEKQPVLRPLEKIELLKSMTVQMTIRHLLAAPMIERLEREIKIRTILIIPDSQKGIRPLPRDSEETQL